ncbi:hypothetical protein L3C95_18110 [Chitinophaga filiformis]|uniref:hypothetical protein n=1 Tax=Chitinophaga filiformis TaxID=104663 RepID=UPI001F404578|nr:hypothetical protein [Chitinophaga filiformis]MCF6404819.1 hypothetical protein [Chitinophaga filiformis]
MSKYALLKEDTSKVDDMGLNIVSLLYPKVVSIPLVIRDLICRECQWSIPTFYRKIRTGNKGEVRISNAEREKILEIVYVVLMDQAENIKDLQKNGASGNYLQVTGEMSKQQV